MTRIVVDSGAVLHLASAGGEVSGAHIKELVPDGRWPDAELRLTVATSANSSA
jgi:hypothetical protein